jgi:O-methyltransferase
MIDQAEVVREMYIDLLEKVVINEIYRDPPILTMRAIKRARAKGYEPGFFNEKKRNLGRDWPTVAHSMIGRKRLDNLRNCVSEVLKNKVAGDLIETGVWRGGACILMRGILKAWGDTSRKVWVADSFEGLPVPNAAEYPADAADRSYRYEELAISMEQVQSNFAAYGLLDDQVQFLKGWFKDTLPTAGIEKLSVIRLDGDMYESTMDGLRNLYHKLSPGGFLIVDDYHTVAGCKAAVQDFIATQGSSEPIDIVEIDGSGVFWQRKNQATV